MKGKKIEVLLVTLIRWHEAGQQVVPVAGPSPFVASWQGYKGCLMY